VDLPVAVARVDTQIGRSRAEEALKRRCETLARANAELEREVAQLRAKVDAG
jgi:cell division protein FtsB